MNFSVGIVLLSAASIFTLNACGDGPSFSDLTLNQNQHDPFSHFKDEKEAFVHYCKERPATDAKIQLQFIAGVTEDRAGIWDVFGPGIGHANRTAADYKFSATLDLPEEKTIKKMTILHGVYGEAWSTSEDFVFNKRLYPVVVFDHGQQIDTDYDQNFGPYSAGSHEFIMYGQRETEPFAGALLVVVFTDNSFEFGCTLTN